ncbi:hypothetical protein ACQPZX_25165 [Actinoplanes sp. CA-142083]|uniref:hypothetical protein n=1 Tax=Actinoplanes sp. CA-142083 TaxID=3239903 RepID=UPI003D8E080F
MTPDRAFAFATHPSETQIAASLRHFYGRAFRVYRVCGALMVVLGALLLPSDEWPFGLFLVVLGERGGFCAVPLGDLPEEEAAAVTAYVRTKVPG